MAFLPENFFGYFPYGTDENAVTYDVSSGNGEADPVEEAPEPSASPPEEAETATPEEEPEPEAPAPTPEPLPQEETTPEPEAPLGAVG